METQNSSIERSAIRFRISGNWTCEEFGAFLHSTNDTYNRINSIFVIRRAIDNEAQRNIFLGKNDQLNDRDYSWHNQFFTVKYYSGAVDLGPPSSFAQLMNVTNAFAEPLQIDAISYASPGWIQLIGDLNPLKVLSEFISKWREENTQREKVHRDSENSNLQIRCKLAARLLEVLPKMKDHDERSRLIDLVENIVEPTNTYIQGVKNNSRILEVAIVNRHDPLPSSKNGD